MRPVFDPGFAKIKELLPKVGRIRRAIFQYCQYSSRYDAFKKGIIENAFNLHYLTQPSWISAYTVSTPWYCCLENRTVSLPPAFSCTIIWKEQNRANGLRRHGGRGQVFQDNLFLTAQRDPGEDGTMLIWQIQDTRKIRIVVPGPPSGHKQLPQR